MKLQPQGLINRAEGYFTQLNINYLKNAISNGQDKNVKVHRTKRRLRKTDLILKCHLSFEINKKLNSYSLQMLLKVSVLEIFQ